MGDSGNKNFPVRFVAKGKLFTIGFDVLMNFPDTYLTWLALSQPQALERGVPIEINKKPEAVRRMLESYSQSSCESSSAGNNREGSLQSDEFQQQQQNQMRGSGRSSNGRAGLVLDALTSDQQKESEYDVILKDAVRDVLHVLTQFRKWGHFHDKAIFLLRWGRSSNCGRVLRPHAVKMYESLTGKLYDVRNSSDFNGSRALEPSSSGFSSVVSAETATFINPTVQEIIVERIRKAGYSCSFVDVGVDRNGTLQWKKHGGREPSSTNAFDGTVRCLVVNTR